MTIDIGIQDEITACLEALRDLRQRVAAQATAAELIEADTDLCLTTRALYARFVFCATTSGVNEKEITAVRNALKSANSALSDPGREADLQCRKAVTERLSDFEQFITRLVFDSSRKVRSLAITALHS